MNKTIIAVIIGIGLIIGASFIASAGPSEKSTTPANNVTIVDGKQIITVTAKGGYQPRKSVAKAGIPTVLRFTTTSTFDCSSAVRIPSMDISKSLEPTGVTEIDLGNPIVGVLQGACGMGMYPFEIDFQS